MGDSSYKNKKILVLDDEADLLDTVCSAFRAAGFLQLITAGSLREARQKCRENTPDIAVLDVMLPDGSGFALCDELRADYNIPIIFLTARGEAEDRVHGLRLGADDYVAKPFSPQELTLRLTAVLRRCYPEDRETEKLVRIDAGRIDFSRAMFVREGGAESPLTAKECALLRVLCQNAGRIVTLDALCEAAWGDNYFGYESSLPVHIRRIREKIERDPSKPVTLLTVRGLGYKLIAKESDADETV